MKMITIAETDVGRVFWKLIEEMDWASDNDYERIREGLEKGTYGKFSADDLRWLHSIFRKKTENLKSAINSYLISVHGDDGRGYPNVETHFSDDGLDDAVCDIVGCGESTYSEYVNDPKKFIDEKYVGKESFAYAWQVKAIYGSLAG